MKTVIDPANPPKTKKEISHLNKAETIAWLSHLGVAHDPAAGYHPLQRALNEHRLGQPANNLNIDIPKKEENPDENPDTDKTDEEIFDDVEVEGVLPDGYSI